MKSGIIEKKRKRTHGHEESSSRSKGMDTDFKGEDAQDRNVKFIIFAPEATQVHLAGDFNDWSSSALGLTRKNKGLWEAEIKLSPGCYKYRFWIDEQWVAQVPGAVQIERVCVQDIPAARRVSDGRGSMDCVLTVK